MLLEPKIEQLILLNLGKKWTKKSRDGLAEIANCKRYWLFVLKSRSTVAPAIVVTTGHTVQEVYKVASKNNAHTQF